MWIDILICLIFLKELIQGWRRGLIYMLGSIILLALALYAAVHFTTPVADTFYSWAEKQGAPAQVSERIATSIMSQNREEDVMAHIGVSESYLNILHSQNPELFETIKHMSEKGIKATNSSVQKAAQELTSKIFTSGMRALAFLLIFTVSLFLMRFLLKLLSQLVNKTPFLGGLNRWAGLALGFLFAVIISGLLASLLPWIREMNPALEGSMRASRLLPYVWDTPFYHSIMSFVLPPA